MDYLAKKKFLFPGVFIILFFIADYANGQAQNAPVTTLGKIGDLLSGQQASVPVTVTGFKNIGSVSLSCDYDNAMLHFVSAEVNPLLNSGVSSYGDNDVGNGKRRLIFGWFGSGSTLPDNTWIIKYVFTYISGTPSLQWFDNGASCAYTSDAAVFLNDLPASAFYIDGNVCGVIPKPGDISGLTTVRRDTTGVLYSIAPLTNISNYTWTVPVGATITNRPDSNAIRVDFDRFARSGDITVRGNNVCGSGPVTTLGLTLTIPVGIEPDTGTSTYDEDFLIFPNPAEDHFTVRSATLVNESLSISIYSLRGELMKKFETGNIGGNEFEITAPGLLPGSYFIVIKNGQKQSWLKLIKGTN